MRRPALVYWRQSSRNASPGNDTHPAASETDQEKSPCPDQEFEPASERRSVRLASCRFTGFGRRAPSSRVLRPLPDQHRSSTASSQQTTPATDRRIPRRRRRPVALRRDCPARRRRARHRSRHARPASITALPAERRQAYRTGARYIRCSIAHRMTHRRILPFRRPDTKSELYC
jgi:hypothetical protein